MFRGILLGVMGSMVFLSVATAAVTKTENFDTDPNWTGVGNTTVNNYGYSGGTNHAGGASAGEAGGTFFRRSTEDYYADTASFADGAFNLSHHLQGSGKFDAFDVTTMNNAVNIGHRSASTSNPSFIGMAISEFQPVNIRIQGYMILNDNTHLTSTPSIVPINSDYSFSYTYDPYGGVNNQGRLSLTVTSLIASFSNTWIVELTAANRTAGATFNAFGMGGEVINNTTENGKVFMDDVTYTVPEPSLGAAAMIVAASCLRRARRVM